MLTSINQLDERPRSSSSLPLSVDEDGHVYLDDITDMSDGDDTAAAGIYGGLQVL